MRRRMLEKTFWYEDNINKRMNLIELEGVLK
jgi:hypothetical protein